ncbi:HAD family phosphatase [Candidatus Pacearchaeota archaeon]|nr:HAD family phosphatase [Candidatus Pacearchaeota archaeon]
MLKGILFDIDGILIDSEDVHYNVLREIFEDYGVNLGEDEYVKRWMIEQTTTPGVIFEYNLHANVSEIRDLRHRMMAERVNEIEMIPGAFYLLERFNGVYDYGLVTSAKRRDFLQKIERFNIFEYFKISVCGDEVMNCKLHKEPYELGCQLLGYNPFEVLVIEDNPTGVKSAHDCGCKVIAYPNGFTKKLDFSLADRVVNSLDEITEEFVNGMYS